MSVFFVLSLVLRCVRDGEAEGRVSVRNLSRFLPEGEPVILKLTVITYFSFVHTNFMCWCNWKLNTSIFCMCVWKNSDVEIMALISAWVACFDCENSGTAIVANLLGLRKCLGASIWPFSGEKKVCALCNYSFEFENGTYNVILYCANAILIESRICSTRCVTRYNP